MTEYDEYGRAIILDSGVVSLKLDEQVDLIGLTTVTCNGAVILTVEEWEAMIEAWRRFKEEISWTSD